MLLDPIVVLACFEGSPSVDLIQKRLAAHATALRVDDRVGLSGQLAARKPFVVLFPLVDSDGLTTLPLIERLLCDDPDIQVVVCVPPGSLTHGLARALTLNARLLAWSTDLELANGINALFAPGTFSASDTRALESLLGGIEPAAMANMLVQCAALAHRRLTVRSLAAALGVSRRTLNRATHRAGWPAPSELIAWGRVLRASAIRWHDTSSDASVARLSGFRSLEELTTSLHRRLGPTATFADLVPLRVSQALRRCIETARA